jgi:manganese oxidase
MANYLRFCVLTIVVVLLLSCGGLDEIPGPPPPNTVLVRDNFFDPPVIQVVVGRVVVWRHSGNNNHTVTSGNPASAGTLFDSGTLQSGGLFTFIFSRPGSYPYFCRIHGASMTGVIQVR